MFIIGRAKQIGDLRTLMHPPIGSLRAQVPIAVIDDAGFLCLQVLRNHSFAITVLKDVSDILALEKYPVGAAFWYVLSLCNVCSG